MPSSPYQKASRYARRRRRHGLASGCRDGSLSAQRLKMRLAATKAVNQFGLSVSVENLGENVTNADEARHSAPTSGPDAGIGTQCQRQPLPSRRKSFWKSTEGDVHRGDAEKSHDITGRLTIREQKTYKPATIREVPYKSLQIIF